jgi:hypothetical protein
MRIITHVSSLDALVDDNGQGPKRMRVDDKTMVDARFVTEATRNHLILSNVAVPMLTDISMQWENLLLWELHTSSARICQSIRVVSLF